MEGRRHGSPVFGELSGESRTRKPAWRRGSSMSLLSEAVSAYREAGYSPVVSSMVEKSTHSAAKPRRRTRAVSGCWAVAKTGVKARKNDARNSCPRCDMKLSCLDGSAVLPLARRNLTAFPNLAGRGKERQPRRVPAAATEPDAVSRWCRGIWHVHCRDESRGVSTEVRKSLRTTIDNFCSNL